MRGQSGLRLLTTCDKLWPNFGTYIAPERGERRVDLEQIAYLSDALGSVGSLPVLDATESIVVEAVILGIFGLRLLTGLAIVSVERFQADFRKRTAQSKV